MKSGKSNSGFAKKKSRAGVTIKTPYGKLHEHSGSAKDERGGERAGGVNNLDHSLSGGSANQHGGPSK